MPERSQNMCKVDALLCIGTQGLSEEEFHNYMPRRHGAECAKIREQYGILKYQMTFNTASTRALLQSMKLPYAIDDHDLQIEYYFRGVSSLLAVSGDEGFKALHVEATPYVRLDEATVALTWVEVYLEGGRLVNIGADGESLQPSFAEQSEIRVSDRPADKYY
ncbi:hypothetical protein INS49_010191 [Diaporthe citri]|uniref:uncharacterized protein n=1 Tax=Diaporthe citri TaxID=83186 RepID=UPI001C81CC0A|nr:uncharacterized protein INS49_010191 [Diaporthe citri]KAG6361962.1 hypothetical protein INS49_010191 [Diaporthe citri]